MGNTVLKVETDLPLIVRVRLYVLGMGYGLGLVSYNRLMGAMVSTALKYASSVTPVGTAEAIHVVTDPETGDEYHLPPGSTLAEVRELMGKISAKHGYREAWNAWCASCDSEACVEYVEAQWRRGRPLGASCGECQLYEQEPSGEA